ncbi:MAG: hypothetical protein Q8R04_07050 [Nanoarchaeota archaeon]|nr:hypothetical protein [Nanoarchaeota archaeon]
MNKKKAKNSKARSKKRTVSYTKPKAAEKISSAKAKEIDFEQKIDVSAAMLSLFGEKNEVAAAKSLLAVPEQHHQFFVADGSVIKNAAELVWALDKMNEDTYKLHANEEKNDFSSWIRDIFGEEKLAEDLKTSASKTEAQLAVAKRLLKEFV